MNLNGAKIFITGADGFIGSHLAEELVKSGARVRALVYYNSWNSIGWLNDVASEIRQEMELRVGDVRDAELMQELLAGIDIVFHLASLISIPYSYYAPESFVETNIRGVVNLLNAARRHKIQAFYHTSTSEVYGTARYIPIDEQHPYQPQSPYSASKIGADMMALSYRYSFGLPVTLIRPFNTYGPRQSLRAIIPTIITQCLRNRKSGAPIKVGNLTPRRDFCFVKDTVQGFIKIAETENTDTEIINIASGTDISIKELINMIQELCGTNLPVEQEVERCRPESSEVYQLCGSNEKIRRLFGWQPEISLKEGLLKTIQWFEQRAGQFEAYFNH